MKTLAIVQARMGSTRFPAKVMRPINGRPMIELLLTRLAKAKRVDSIVLATSDDSRNQPLIDHVSRMGYEVFQGSENDVLDRYFQAAKLYRPEIIVRITGDCPLIDPDLVDDVISAYEAQSVDYASNILPPSYPDGLDVEVFSFQALEQAALLAKESREREHVTPFIRESSHFKKGTFSCEQDYSQERWTVDESCDFDVIAAVFEHFYPRTDFGWREVVALSQVNPALFQKNRHLIRNEGSKLGAGQKLWKYAKQIIPGGNMLLSKRAEMFLPEQWPAYFSKAKGCKVWDLEGREYIDMSIMGVGTNILGYGHPDVDDAVHKAVDAGNMSTLNCFEEVKLAEKLIEINPWADMVRFARSGGEANAIAIRIARAATGKDKVAVCGYHGWHDWYLASNLSDEKNLDGHLLPGLEPLGVPAGLRGSVVPFNYNNFSELESLVDHHDIGAIKMEVVRNQDPQDDFLLKVRELASKRGIVLIFDECTSGFRQSFGGLHQLHGVEPDMAMYGKAMGNGYAITAVVGRREVMQAAQGTFISSTFWTERIGPVAALSALGVMERTKSWEQITQRGLEISARWRLLAQRYEIPLVVSGLPALTGFTFNSPNALAYKTLITQEMLARSYLAATSVYVCTEHTSSIMEGYFDALEPVFALIKECEEGRDIRGLLKGPVCHAGFKRLN